MRSIEHVEANAAVSDAGPLSAEQVELLRPYRWVHEWYH
jgi:hypothetical protein